MVLGLVLLSNTVEAINLIKGVHEAAAKDYLSIISKHVVCLGLVIVIGLVWVIYKSQSKRR